MSQKILDRIEEYEHGKLSFERTVLLFQDLVDTGMIWKVDTNLCEEAYKLIERGYVLQR
jgi:hypothetical protein|tara:strand:+ start:206 stop:382 length:177 start_codon:yes stop_codon:yes gene_type:complete